MERAHPGPGPAHSAGTGPCKAVQAINVEFFGHTYVNFRWLFPHLNSYADLLRAHASAAPWEGQNALDAAFLAYSSVSVLRQQIHPSHRVHGIVEGRNWAANSSCGFLACGRCNDRTTVIPDYAKMTYIVRAPTWEETEVLRVRVTKCFEYAMPLK